jgi:hypothetical protein
MKQGDPNAPSANSSSALAGAGSHLPLFPLPRVASPLPRTLHAMCGRGVVRHTAMLSENGVVLATPSAQGIYGPALESQFQKAAQLTPRNSESTSTEERRIGDAPAAVYRVTARPPHSAFRLPRHVEAVYRPIGAA